MPCYCDDKGPTCGPPPCGPPLPDERSEEEKKYQEEIRELQKEK